MSDTHVFVTSHALVRSTKMAELHDLGDHGEVWIPKSVIGARGTNRIELARWWAEKEGLVDAKDNR